MKLKYLIGIVVLYLGIFYLATISLNTNLTNKQNSSDLPETNNENPSLMVKVNNEEVELEEYVVRVVASEMPANFELEALKAQAVAARSFVISREFVVGNTTSSQVCKSFEELKKAFKDDYEPKIAKIKEAVKATNNEVMLYDNKVVNALYFSTSNGFTVNANEYYSADVEYLKQVSSSWDLEVNPNAIVEKVISNQDIIKAFGLKGLPKIEIVSRYDNNRVRDIKVNNVLYSGREVREKLSLRSTDFTISKTTDAYTFTTIGYGHGVGMSQYGAQGMALDGFEYQAILKHYYQNVEIIKYNTYKVS